MLQMVSKVQKLIASINKCSNGIRFYRFVDHAVLLLIGKLVGANRATLESINNDKGSCNGKKRNDSKRMR